MKFITTYLLPGEEVKYRTGIHIFLFLQPVILLGIGYMCYLDSVSIRHYLGLTLLFLGLVSCAACVCKSRLHRGYYGRGDQLLLLCGQSVPVQTGEKYADCFISDVNKDILANWLKNTC